MNDVRFGFQEVILDRIHLSIQDRAQIIGLLGPNGAGKTTLLNILANYYQRYEGDIATTNTFFLVPDQSYIPSDYSIDQCLVDFPKLYRRFNVARAEEMIQFLNLDRQKKISKFSKGMKEQVHIVFALAQDVDTYLFDEPLAAVDPFHREILIRLIKDYRRSGSNVILSTHLIEDIEDIFDEVIFIASGEIILHQTKQELLGNQGARLEEKYLEVMGHAYFNRKNP